MKFYTLFFISLVTSIPLDSINPGSLVAQLIGENSSASPEILNQNQFIPPSFPPPPPPRPNRNRDKNIRIRNDVEVRDEEDDKYNDPFNPFDPYGPQVLDYDPNDPQPNPPVFNPIVLGQGNQGNQSNQGLNSNAVPTTNTTPNTQQQQTLTAQEDLEVEEVGEQ